MKIRHTYPWLWFGVLIGSLMHYPAQAVPPVGQTWNLVWSDEFTGTGLDTNLWGFGKKPWGTTDNSPCLITPEDTYLTNGTLVNRSRMDTNGVFGSYKYSCGWAWSKTWLSYGYLEIRAQYPAGKGQWPAWWMLRSGWPPEFDIAEFRGATGTSSDYMTQAVYDEAAQWNTTTLGGDYTGWRTYGFEWGPGYLKWYIDGTLTKTVTSTNIPSQPMYVILSAGLDSTADATTGFPNYYVIDYFRWYQVSPTNAPGAPSIQVPATGSNQVTLNWTTVLGASRYLISRSTTSGGPYTVIATNTGITQTTCTDISAVNFTSYYYVVAAANAYGQSLNSGEVSAMPVPPPLSTGRPTIASSYQSGHDPFFGNDGTNATRWTASGSSFPQWWKVDLGSVQTIRKVGINWENSANWSYKYRIETSSDDVDYATVVNQTGRTATGDSADIFSVPARYVRVTVTGQGSGGWASFYECQIFGGMPPAAPVGLTATPGDGLVTLQWNSSPGATGYSVKRAAFSGGPFSEIVGAAATTNFVDRSVLNGMTYYYVIVASNALGQSGPSGEASAHPIPSVPPQVAIRLEGRDIAIVWPLEHTGWRLQTQTSSAGMGLGTNWSDLPTSTATNQLSFTINQGYGSGFFRLICP